jgi:flavin reductase (DIM6/NTAB) family NADH-FMN oxidoreductase RutF
VALVVYVMSAWWPLAPARVAGVPSHGTRAHHAFVVHLLHAAQADLARRFAADIVDKFAGLAYGFNTSGVPGFDEGGLHLECTLHAEFESGDHVIVVGLVEASERLHDFEPLVYARHTFFSPGAQALAVQ